MKNKILLYALILACGLYLVDSLVYYLIFSDGESFLQVTITAVPVSELYNRLIMFAGIMIFGFLVMSVFSDLKFENELLKNQNPGQNGKIDAGFFNGLSYQIRTPINAIVGFTELLKDPNVSEETKLSYINHIHNSGNNLIKLMNTFSDILKIESQQLTIVNDEFDLNSLLYNVYQEYEQYRINSGKSGLEIILKNKEKSGFMVIGDKERLTQVLSNLLENSIRMTETGSIEFGYRIKEENMIDFFIKDTGMGFSMDRLEVIFSRYQRLTDNHNQPFDTSSLRVGISKSLVKLMGGSMWAESRLGKGTNIYFSLALEQPAAKPAEAFPGVVSETRSIEKDWKKYKILIAEDVESNFVYLQELLRPTQIEIEWARNGREALNAIKNDDRLRLVLMDILMPEMDGIEAARLIKQIKPDLPVIAQTAYSLDSDTQKDDIANFDGFLIKPIWSPQLIGIIEKYLPA